MDSTNDQPQLERIVAYLDGELSAAESAQVEQQLATDENFRQELQGAERAWTALDQLPMAQVGDEFSRTTMEMVVDAARHDVEARTIAIPTQQRRHKAATALLVTMAVLLGALTVRVLWNNPNRRLVADLPVINNVDIYSQFQSVDFLRELDRRLGNELEPSAAEAEQLAAKLTEFQLVLATDSRQSWLASLPADQQVTLRAKFNRFRDLSSQRQDELRALHQQIESADDRERLTRTMFRYRQWLNELTPSEQYILRQTPASNRAPEVAKAMIQAAHDQEFKLSPEQLHELFAEVRPFIQDVMEQKKPDFERERKRRSRRERRDFESLSRPEQFRRAFQFVTREFPQEVDKLNDIIVEALPVEVGQAFQELSLREKADRMRAWAWQFHSLNVKERGPGERRASSEISEQELADFFVDLNPEDKEKLLALPRDQMHQRLELMIRGRGRRSLQQWGERAGPPPFDRPPPDGERRGRFDQRHGPGPPPRGGRRFEDGPEGRLRDPERDRRPRHPPPDDRDRSPREE